ncbi:MAG: NAD(P)/FAD-dependent oxidoreductase [Glycomyces artemisiae]|uniref:NAD(P)/FAD-dependent oxidoreductase n=1 Tax=Glycomyces artemisiae TaxID=1076443 RepID=A0A850CAR5_9ACTN|nr:NAD(P)/FAD-dependent oxidoreductase [Glycomyces artemisiae]
MFDAVIAGGGPAGMAAALTLGRARRRVLLVDSGQGRNAPAAAVHNLFTRDGTPPAELRAIGRAELARYPAVEIREGVEIAFADAESGGFALAWDGGGARARRLLLATGLRDVLPPTPGLAALWGRSAFHCPYCHGYETVGASIAVVGSTMPRLRLAVQLRRFGERVTLCTDGASLDPAQRELLAANEVAVECGANARMDGRGGRLEAVAFADGSALEASAVFVENTAVQRSELPDLLGCKRFEDGCVEVDEFGRTTVPGVSAAGDMARRASVPMPFAAVTAAAASGTIAAAAIDQSLLSEALGQPEPFAAAPAARIRADRTRLIEEPQ